MAPTEHPLSVRRLPPTGFSRLAYSRTPFASEAIRAQSEGPETLHSRDTYSRFEAKACQNVMSHGKGLWERALLWGLQEPPMARGLWEGPVSWGLWDTPMAWVLQDTPIAWGLPQGPIAWGARDAHGMAHTQGPWQGPVVNCPWQGAFSKEHQPGAVWKSPWRDRAERPMARALQRRLPSPRARANFVTKSKIFSNSAHKSEITPPPSTYTPPTPFRPNHRFEAVNAPHLHLLYLTLPIMCCVGIREKVVRVGCSLGDFFQVERRSRWSKIAANPPSYWAYGQLHPQPLTPPSTRGKA